MPEHFFHSSFCKPLLVPVAIKMGSTRVGGLVEIAAACMWLWQSQSGMNLEFPPAPIPAGPMPDIASLRPIATRIAAADYLGGRREYRILSGMGTWL